MMLDHPAPGRHLPAGVKVGDRSQSGEESVDESQAGENQENTPFQRGSFPVAGPVVVGFTALEYSEWSIDRRMRICAVRGR